MEEEEKKVDETDKDIAIKIRDWFKKSRDDSESWRKEAKECFDFVAGHQWNEEDMLKLKKEMRPPVTFNWIAPIVSGILGLEPAQRSVRKFIPTDTTDTLLSDVLNTTCETFRDIASIDVEEAQAFEDLVTCGMGWTNPRWSMMKTQTVSLSRNR